MNTAVSYNPRTNFHMHVVQSPTTQTHVNQPSCELMQSVERFKSTIFHCLENENKQQGNALNTHAMAVAEALDHVSMTCHRVLGPASSLSETQRQNLGTKIRQQMVPYLLMANIPFRFYTKPRGYAGDFLTIAQMYADQPQGINQTGKILDQLFLANPCSMAVKNRRSLLADVIRAIVEERGPEATHVTSFACGPAQELFDIDQSVGEEQTIYANLIDIDLQALAHIGGKLETEKTRTKFKLHQENLIHLALGRRKLNLSPQNLVYSIGLIDYFDDDLVIKLITYAHSILAPGGELVLGNFHQNNPVKEFMDHVLEWKLIHRTEDDMNRLFESSAFKKPCDKFKYESQAVNMFAFARKDV